MSRPGPERLEQRAERLRDLLEKDPDDATSWFALGHALLDLARPDAAVEPLRRAVTLEPGYSAALRDLGRALLESGAVREAASTLEGAIASADGAGDLQTARESEVFLRRARRLLGHEEAPAPRRPSRRAAPLARDGRQPKSGEARRVYREGFDHFANDRYDEAIELFARALEIDAHLAIAWNGLSLAHRQKGELEAAIDAGRRLIELEPDDPLSHTNLSILYQRKGMIPEAEEERAIAMQLQMKAQRRA